MKKRGPKEPGPLGPSQRQILEKLASHDGWWSPERRLKLGVGYRVERIMKTLALRGLLSEQGGVYILTVAGRQETQNNAYMVSKNKS